MKLGSPILRVALGIVMLTLSLLLTADFFFGMSSESVRPQLLARKHLAETLAVQYSALASREDHAAMKAAMGLLVKRNPEILSTAMKKSGGAVLAEAGDHRRHWRGALPLESSETHARVPIFDGSKRWGTLEVRFTEIAGAGIAGWFASTWFKMLCYVLLTGTIAYFFYIRRTLRHLDPTSVIPARVRAAFDVLSEGVAFVDVDERIVLANSAFASIIGISPELLMGVKLGSLGWSRGIDGGDSSTAPPWISCISSGSVHSGVSIAFDSESAGERRFMVNTVPILDDARQSRGALVTFDDVTELESKKHELEVVVAELRESRDQVQRQNEKLEFIATRDPLTNCMNRRAFVIELDEEVNRARRDGTDLCCVMIDIDHFKSVNDTYGHPAGDTAIRFTAETVSEITRGFDIVCRYGGEEFCVLLPGADLAMARSIAERIRKAIESKSAPSIPEISGRVLTASLGISMLHKDIENPMDLVDLADQALYVSKTSGRNRISTTEDAPVSAASVA